MSDGSGGRILGGEPLRCRRWDARDSQASWITSVSSCLVNSPIRPALSRPTGDPEMWRGEERGPFVLDQRQLVLLRRHPEDDDIPYRSPVSGSAASGLGLRKKMNDLPPT